MRFYLFFVFMWLIISCDNKPKEKSRTVANKELPNLIVISLDTTRADHLGCYGSLKKVTPSLDLLAQESICFQQTIAPAPYTLPSHSSLFTGTYPLAHGVRDNIGFKLPDDCLTLSEILKKHGVQTGAVTGARVLDAEFGLAQGFTHYDQNIPYGHQDRNAYAVFSAAKEWLAKQKGKHTPVFLWIHLYDPHLPYEHSEPFRTKYKENPYDGELAYMDSEIGKFLEYLKQNQWYQESIITVVGDHGESLGDHGENTHGYFAYDSTLRVPFILKPQGKRIASRVVQEQVRVIDVMPTLLSLMKLPIPNSVQGQDLTVLMKEDSGPLNLVSYSEAYHPFFRYGFRPIKAWRTGKYKFINTENFELYDLSKDPKELQNLSSKEPELVKKMQQEMLVYEKAYSVKRDATVELDPSALAMLAAMGYTSNKMALVADESTLPDAVQNFKCHGQISSITEDLRENRLEESQEKIHRLTRAYPELTYTRKLQVDIYIKRKEYQKAIAFLKETLKIDPNDTKALNQLSFCYHLIKETNKALETSQRLLKIAPNDEEARKNFWNIASKANLNNIVLGDLQQEIRRGALKGFAWLYLGLYYQRMEDLQNAEQAFLKAKEDPRSAQSACFELAKLSFQQAKHSKALKFLDESLKYKADSTEVYNLYGLIYFQQKKMNKAIEYLEKALFFSPDNIIQRKNLIIACLQSQKRERAYRFVLNGITKKITASEHFLLIELLIKMQKYSEAKNQLSVFTKKYPKQPKGFLYFGEVALKLKENEFAVQLFSRFLQLYSKEDALTEKVKNIIAQLKKK